MTKEKGVERPLPKRAKTVKEADAKAALVKNIADLEKYMVVECYKLESGEIHDVNQIMAYARKAKLLKK